MSLTQPERDILTHCLGYNYSPRKQRNQYLAEVGSRDWDLCDGLAKRGLMIEGGTRNFGVPETMFSATPEGEVLVRPRPQRATPGQRRYQRWLEVADCYPDWKFIDFCKAETRRKEDRPEVGCADVAVRGAADDFDDAWRYGAD